MVHLGDRHYVVISNQSVFINRKLSSISRQRCNKTKNLQPCLELGLQWYTSVMIYCGVDEYSYHTVYIAYLQY